MSPPTTTQNGLAANLDGFKRLGREVALGILHDLQRLGDALGMRKHSRLQLGVDELVVGSDLKGACATNPARANKRR